MEPLYHANAHPDGVFQETWQHFTGRFHRQVRLELYACSAARNVVLIPYLLYPTTEGLLPQLFY